MEPSNETIKDKITTGINISMQRVLDHLKINDFSEVPLAAKCHALADLEMKFLLSGENKNLNEGYYYVVSYYLKDYYLKNVEQNKNIDSTELQKRKLKPEQKEFLLQLRKGLIEEYSTYNLPGSEKYELAKSTCLASFKDGKAENWGKLILSTNENNEIAKNALKYELLHLDEILLKHNTDDFTFDVFLYAYYVSKYREFLFEKDPHVFDEKNGNDLSNYSNEVKKIYQRMDDSLKNFKTNVVNTSNGLMPEFILNYVNSLTEDLISLKSEIGGKDSLYISVSTNILSVVVGWTNHWIKKVDKDMLLMTSLRRNENKTLIDICSDSFNKIDNIEMDADTRAWFSTQKQYFELYKQKITPSSGCYIATMAYGDYNHPQVVQLRNFRDNRLANYYIGREFIRFYYWLSPKIVECSKNNSFIVQTSRKILDIFIKFI